MAADPLDPSPRGDPRSARIELALSYLHQRRFAEAAALDRITLTESERDFAPGSEEVIEARALLAGSLMEAGELKEAEALADALVAQLEPLPQPPPNAGWLSTAQRILGLIAEAAGKPDKSVDLHRRRYERAAAYQPRDEQMEKFTRTCARHLGWAHIAQRNAPEARRAFERSLRGRPPYPLYLLGLAACDALEQGSPAPVDALILEYRLSGKVDPDTLDKTGRRMARALARQ